MTFARLYIVYMFLKEEFISITWFSVRLERVSGLRWILFLMHLKSRIKLEVDQEQLPLDHNSEIVSELFGEESNAMSGRIPYLLISD